MRLYGGRWRGAHPRCRPSASLMNNGASLGKWTWKRWENYKKNKKKKEFSVSFYILYLPPFRLASNLFSLFLFLSISISFSPVVYCSRVYLKRLWCDPVWTWNILFFFPFSHVVAACPTTFQLQRGKEKKKKYFRAVVSYIQGIIKVSDLIYQWPIADPPTASRRILI